MITLLKINQPAILQNYFIVTLKKKKERCKIKPKANEILY